VSLIAPGNTNGDTDLDCGVLGTDTDPDTVLDDWWMGTSATLVGTSLFMQSPSPNLPNLPHPQVYIDPLAVNAADVSPDAATPTTLCPNSSLTSLGFDHCSRSSAAAAAPIAGEPDLGEPPPRGLSLRRLSLLSLPPGELPPGDPPSDSLDSATLSRMDP
jgi:hypothetical protein